MFISLLKTFASCTKHGRKVTKFSATLISQQSRSVQLLVSTDWLADQLRQEKSAPNVRVVHAVMSHEEFDQGHVPGAVCFNISACRDSTSPYPLTMPGPAQFEKYVNEQIYVDNEDHVVIYDSSPMAPSLVYGARVWFMFRAFGHEKISLLNGGFHRWLHEGRSIEKSSTGFTGQSSKNFKANFRPKMLIAYEDVVRNLETRHFQHVDTRAPQIFQGVTGDKSGGHIPDSKNMPFFSLVDEATKLMLSESELRKLFEKFDVNLQKPIFTSCNAGVTACAALFASNLCGKTDTKLYDGSWSEWAQKFKAVGN